MTYELRCLVCQNQNLAESNARLAVDLRQQIANMIKSGDSKTQIIHYFVKRYGDFILYKPPVQKTTWVLWYGPFALLGLALLSLIIIVLMMTRKRDKSELSQSDQDRLRAMRLK